jgi:molybdopterin synthase sulfur carrier subunit
MKIRVKFFATFKELFGGGEKEIELGSGASIQDLINLLCVSAQCRQEIFGNSDKLRPYIKILKNGRHIQFLDGVHTKLGEGDVVTVFPPAGGG